MDSLKVYRWLMAGGSDALCDRFDAHVLASTLSLAVVESAAEGRPLSSAVGVQGPELTDFVGEIFPHARELFERLETPDALEIPEDEACLRDLLRRCTTNGTPFEEKLAPIVARRAQRPNHLWQDLGLRSRRELSWLMERHFEWLSSRNSRDMKWKKFLYRTICYDGSFPVCTAPSCSECCDFEGCFGDESGESLLAVARLEADRERAARSR
jgi:nitrogen fixation protein NifQ